MARKAKTPHFEDKQLRSLYQKMKHHPDIHTVKKSQFGGIQFTYDRRRLEIRRENGRWHIYSGNYRVMNLGEETPSMVRLVRELDYIAKNLDAMKATRW